MTVDKKMKKKGSKPSTPKPEKPTTKKDPKTVEDKLVFEEGQNELDLKKVLSTVDALIKLRDFDHAKPGKKDLFEEGGSKIQLQIAGIKLPKDSKQQVIKMKLPHSITSDVDDVCLFVKDLEKGLRVDHEPTVQHFKDFLEEKKIKGISQVISLRELKVEYKPFEAKTALCHKFDTFLADDRIIRFLPKFLGKPFYKRKKLPIQVNLQAKDLQEEIDRAIKTVTLPLNHHGTSAVMKVAHSSMSKEQIAENIMEASKVLAKRYPGGWKNIRTIHMKTEKSPALPLHISLTDVNDVGFVDVDIPKKIRQTVVSGELSTLPGAEVTVYPFGKVKVTKGDEPESDDEKNEPFVEGSEDETVESDEEVKKKEKKTKKRKAEEKKEVAKKKKKEAPKKEASESEDEIEDAEIEYMKKVADEEEEMEKNMENDDGADQQQSNAEEQSSEEENEDESADENESEESGDEAEIELDEADILVDDDDDGDSDAGSDDDLILKNQPNYGTYASEEEEEEEKPKLKRKTKKEKRKERKAEKLQQVVSNVAGRKGTKVPIKRGVKKRA